MESDKLLNRVEPIPITKRIRKGGERRHKSIEKGHKSCRNSEEQKSQAKDSEVDFSKTIFVKGFTKNVTEAHLKDIFKNYGCVKRVKIENVYALRAIAYMNNAQIDGNKVYCDIYKDKGKRIELLIERKRRHIHEYRPRRPINRRNFERRSKERRHYKRSRSNSSRRKHKNSLDEKRRKRISNKRHKPRRSSSSSNSSYSSSSYSSRSRSYSSRSKS